MLLLALLGALFGVGRVAPMPQPLGDVVAPAPPDAPVEAPVESPAQPVREAEPQVPTGRFTTAVEVRPILDATRPTWIAVREVDGQDLLYFTNLLAWRCGLWEVRYGLNGAPPETVLPLEPCHDDTAAPNAMVDLEGFPPYVTQPDDSIDSIDVAITYDDGTEDGAVYARSSVLMPG